METIFSLLIPLTVSTGFLLLCHSLLVEKLGTVFYLSFVAACAFQLFCLFNAMARTGINPHK